MKRLYSIIIFILFTNILFSNTVASEKESIKIINIINHQRMLSQQITKAYLYAGNNINTDEANKEIYSSLKEFKNSYQKIDFLTKNPTIKNAMNFVKKSTKEFTTLSQRPLNIENAKSILDLSESILKQSQQIILFLKKDIHNDNSKFINILGEQEMLAQRIAKYYIAYKLYKTEDNKINMEKSIELFAKNHKKIMKYRGNPVIKEKLKEINRLWNITNKFYINIEKSGELPLSVFQTTNNITHNINNIIKIYTLQIK